MHLSTDLRTRVEDRIREWQVIVDSIKETDTSVLIFGQRSQLPLVVKVIKNRGDEWRSGEILKAFQGHGVVRVYETINGAMLLERLTPGNSLRVVDDDAATEVLFQTIAKMSPRTPMDFVPTVEDWGKGFQRYTVEGNDQLPKDLFLAARDVYFDLCGTQKERRLLHGDLHHDNVLFDTNRSWIAIDPKGVVGELEYEIGAALRNPVDTPQVFTEPSIISKRLKYFASKLNLNEVRVLSWAFAQAILATIWLIEDGFKIEPNHGWIKLAKTLQPMLEIRK